MAYTGPRQWLVEQLTPLLPGYRLVPWDNVPTVSDRTVIFYRSRVAQSPEAPLGSFDHSITLYVATPKTVGEAALDDLDDALDDVLLALLKVTGVTWSDATYKVLGDPAVQPAFEISVTVRTQLPEEE